ncbi:MAG: hypothetical protein KKD18_04470 [Nanoarchaeota archaeon]|nr:hypothetical protein [Nanoarchaeota archaeon]
MGFEPNDIKPPRDLPGVLSPGPYGHRYTETFGKTEYEVVAQRIVFESQGWNQWVRVSDRLLSAALNDGRSISPDDALKVTRSYLRDYGRGRILRAEQG